MNENVTPTWVKRLAQIGGALLMLPGLVSLPNLFCIAPLMALDNYSGNSYVLFSLMLTLVTFGTGLAAWLFAGSALKGQPSRLLKLPSAMIQLAVFGLFLLLGLVITGLNIMPALFFPPILLVLAVLPPLWAVTWFVPGSPISNTQLNPQPTPAAEASLAAQTDQLTWRRGLMAFIGAGTIGMGLAVILDVLLPVTIIALVDGLPAIIANSLSAISSAPGWVFRALTSPSSIYLFIELAVIVPLAGEFAKPLIILPLIKRLDARQTFWLGALAGAGFAALETMIFASADQSFWVGIILIRALGGALQPLGAGLVALGWRDVLRGEQRAGKKWLLRFSIACLMNMVWNSVSLLIITLVGTRYYYILPPQIGLRGFLAAAAILVFLFLLGISALWIGRDFGYAQTPSIFHKAGEPENNVLPSERVLAIWAFICLIAIVPALIVGFNLWLR